MAKRDYGIFSLNSTTMRPSIISFLWLALCVVAAHKTDACTLCQMADAQASQSCALHGSDETASAGDPVAAFQVDDRFVDDFGGVAIGSAGVQGDPITLTWSIVPNGTQIIPALNGESSANSSLITFLNSTFSNSTIWMPLLEGSFNRWSELSGVTFTHEPNDDGMVIGDEDNAFPGQSGVRGDIRLSGHNIDNNSGTLAYNYFPNRADMVIDTADGGLFGGAANNYRFFRNTVMHEIGHGLGFSHILSGNANFLMEGNITTSFDGPQLDDILAVHRNYGDVNEKSNGGAGNDTFGNATPLGFIGDLQSKSVGTDANDAVVAPTDIDFVSIDDNSDTDYFSFIVGGPSEVDLTLTPRGPTYNEAPVNPPTTQSPLVTSQLSDLSLEIFATNGTTSLGFSNNGGLGVVESLSDISLAAAGTYYIAVTGAHDNVQLYQLDVAVAAVPEPATWVLGLLATATLLGFLTIRHRAHSPK